MVQTNLLYSKSLEISGSSLFGYSVMYDNKKHEIENVSEILNYYTAKLNQAKYMKKYNKAYIFESSAQISFLVTGGLIGWNIMAQVSKNINPSDTVYIWSSLISGVVFSKLTDIFLQSSVKHYNDWLESQKISLSPFSEADFHGLTYTKKF